MSNRMARGVTLALLVAAGFGTAMRAGAASLDDMDWSAPAFQSLHPASVKAVEQARKNRISRQRAVLAAEYRKWSDELAQRERTRNVKGMAIATAAVDALKKSLESLAATGTATAPESTRAELAQPLAAIRAQLEAAQRAADPVFDAALAEFKKALAEAGVADPGDAELRAAFDRWVAAPPAPAKPAAGNTPPAPGPAGVPTPPASVGAPSGDYFAQSGTAQGWQKLGRWTARISAMDIISIKVFEQEGRTSGKFENPLFGTLTPWTAEFTGKLRPGRYHFRLKRLPDHLPVDVEQWPTEANQGTLEFRTPMPEQKNLAIGFEIEYAGTEPLVAVSIETEPAGAQVEVDGMVYTEDGKPFRTPGVLQLPAGPHALRIFAEGHVEQKVARYEVREGAAISARLTPITARTAPGRQLRVDPKVIWGPTGLTVPVGAKISVVAGGEWACGAKKEMCGPGGYPAGDVKFGHYYLNPRNSPRQVRDAPYGALIARIGTGLPFVVRVGQEWVAREAGTLQFDVNEETDPKLRSDNLGMLELRVQITPPAR